MPTLRDRVREALSKREPTELEARDDLDAILARSRGGHGKRVRRTWPLLAAPALAAALLTLYLAYPRREPLTMPAPTATRGVHLYLHVTGEPADRAMTLDLDSKGDL